MKCKNCRFKFEEGIFCPECGTQAEIQLCVEERERNLIKVWQSMNSS